MRKINYTTIKLLVLSVGLSSCIKEEETSCSKFIILNNSDHNVGLTNFTLPNTKIDTMDTLQVASRDHVQSESIVKGPPGGAPWNIYYADTVSLIFSNTTQLVFTDDIEIENNIRKEESWVIEDEGNRTKSFTYTITNEDYDRAIGD